MLHVGKEVRIGDLKEVFSEMRAQVMFAQYSLYCAAARVDTKEFRVIVQMFFGPS